LRRLTNKETEEKHFFYPGRFKDGSVAAAKNKRKVLELHSSDLSE
jgi:hypothetical protein